MQAVWPALWPAVVMTALLRAAAARVAPTNLFEVALYLGVGGVLYLVLFVGVAIGGEERRFYITKLRGLMERQPRVQAAA